jgi:oligoendopeptidase F
MSASIFVGADVSLLYKYENIYKNVTKYDPNTGKPYTRQVVDYVVETIGELNLKTLKELGLTLQNKCLGIVLTEDLDYYDVYTVDLLKLTEIVNKVESILKEFNLNLSVKIMFNTDFSEPRY